MAGINVGSVGVTVYPDTSDFWQDFKAKTKGGAEQAGRSLGDDLSNGIPEKLARAVDEGLNGNDAGHQGSDAGKSFADDFSRQVFTRITAALKALPTRITVDADTAPAIAELEGVRAALMGEHANIGVGVAVDEGTLARLAALRAELEFLSHDNIDTSSSVASLHRLTDEMGTTAAAERALLGDTDRMARAFDGAGFAGGGFLQILLKLALFVGPALIPMLAVGTGALLGMGLAAGGAALAFLGLYTNSNQAASDALIARWTKLKDVVTTMSAPAAGAFMSRLAGAFDQINTILPSFTGMFTKFADAAGIVAGNVGLGLLSLFTALEPSANRMAGNFIRWSNALVNIGQNKTFRDFLDYATRQGPVVADALRNLADVAVRVLQAFAPWGNIIIAALDVLANTLNAIPLPVLQTMALLFEGFLTYKLLGAVFDGIALGILKMGLAAESANMGTFATKLVSVAAGAEKFAAVGGLIGPVTAGVTVALLAGLFVWQKHEQSVQAAKAAIQQYTSALQQDNGAIAENTAKVAAKNLQDAGAYDIAKKLGISQATLTQATLGNVTAQSQIKTAVDGATQAYAKNLQVYGMGAEAVDKDAKARNDAAINLKKILGDQVGDLDAAKTAQENLNAATSQYISPAVAADVATRSLGAAQAYTTVTVNGVQLAMLQGTSAADVYHNALQNLSGNSLDAAQAQLSFEGAVQAATKALQDNSGDLDIHTAKGLADQQAVLQMISAANQHADAVFKQTGSVDAANAALAEDESAMYDAAAAAGVNKDKVNDLINKYAAVPSSVATVVTANTDQAMARLATLQGQINSVVSAGAAAGVPTGMSTAYAAGVLEMFPGQAEGGPVVGVGTDTSDSNLRRLSAGEFVMRASAVRAIGLPVLSAMNAAGVAPSGYMKPRGMAAGGAVTAVQAGADPLIAEVRMLRAGVDRLTSITAVAPQQTGREVGRLVGTGGSRRDPG